MDALVTVLLVLATALISGIGSWLWFGHDKISKEDLSNAIKDIKELITKNRDKSEKTEGEIADDLQDHIKSDNELFMKIEVQLGRIETLLTRKLP